MKKTLEAYRFYSLFYAPIALLAYTWIWRGNIFKQIRFFRDSLHRNLHVLDLATGDGTLTRAALIKQKTYPKPHLTVLDISPDMLRKAIPKLPAKTTVIQGDVMHLPFEANSQPLVTCFGGCNSFPSAEGALQEMYRILQPGGYVRGSVLLLPKAPWKQRKIHAWIEKGYQSEVIHLEAFVSWLHQAGFTLTSQFRMGDVLLFEGRKG